MKYTLPLIAALLLHLGTATASGQSNATAPVDVTKANESFTPQASITPEVKDKKTADRLQSRRFQNTRDLREKTTAPVGDRRSTIELKEMREKTVREKKPIPVETRTFDMSRYDGKRSRIQTANLFDTSGKANRFQSYIKDAAPITRTSEPYIEKRASLDTINRFAFRRNGITTTGNNIPVKPAGRAVGTPGTASAPDS